MSSAGFVLDLGRCVGCGACVLACRLENSWPPEVAWRRVISLNLDRYPDGPTYHFSLACHHCSQPACLNACPSGAYERHSSGAVVLRQDRCLGCRYCEMACPFGAPAYDQSARVMTKCDLCSQRLDSGREPACTAACPTGALSFRKSSEWGRQTIPGFVDPAGCRPHLQLGEPRGRRRTSRFRKLQETLER